MLNALERRVAERIGRQGPQAFSAVMEAALYDPELGFYAAGGTAGRRGDFLTSPEVGPLFGAVLGRALDRWWHDGGEPDPFLVVEAGAGRGTLARAVLGADPACGPALRYVAVERSAALRSHHPDGVLSRDDLPDPDGPAVVVANELLDNLAFDLWERRGGRWLEVRVDVSDADEPAGADAGGARLVERLVDKVAPSWLPDAADGARVPVQAAAGTWLGRALAVAGDEGRVVVVDYCCATTAELAARPPQEWLRTYRAHQRGADVLDGLGTRDITAEVALDQLAACRRPSRVSTQAEFLVAHGIDALVAQGRRTWAERAHVGDLDSLRARSRVTEAEALTEPAGLGAFCVLEWSPPAFCD